MERSAAPFSPGWSAVERVVLTGLLAAVWATLMLALRNPSRLQVGVSSLPLVFWFWFLVLYLSVGGLFLGGFGLWLRTGWGPGKVRWMRGVPAATAAWLVQTLWWNPVPWKHPETMPDGLWLLRFGPALMGTVLLALVVAAWNPLRKRSLFRGIVLVVMVGFVVLMLRGDRGGAPLPGPPPRGPSTPLLVVGIDGADWDHLRPLMRRGELPHLRRLVRGGIHGPLETLRPTTSPAIWTTVATGYSPERHGIESFVAHRIVGFPGAFNRLRPVEGLGFYWMADVLRASRVPVSSHLRLKPAYWNIASHYGVPVSVLNWWGTWPVEPIRGIMVSERIHYRGFSRVRGTRRPRHMIHPPALAEDLRSLLVAPEQVPYAFVRGMMDVDPDSFAAMKKMSWRHHELKREFPYLASSLISNRRLARALLRQGRRSYRVTTWPDTPPFATPIWWKATRAYIRTNAGGSAGFSRASTARSTGLSANC